MRTIIVAALALAVAVLEAVITGWVSTYRRACCRIVTSSPASTPPTPGSWSERHRSGSPPDYQTVVFAS